MEKPSTQFEKKIKRIHDLIEQEGSIVTWDDHLPDPDNPEQARQIDISIKRDGKLTIVECRFHKKSQDVKWIEELIGRRLSLNADALIAVSSGGFTKGAIKKADRYGIILRDLLTLTEEEISKWGYSTRVWLNFYQYHNINFEFTISKKLSLFLDLKKVQEELIEKNVFYDAFQTIKNYLDKKELHATPEKIYHIKSKLVYPDQNFSNFVLKELNFSFSVNSIGKDISTPSVLVYSSPGIKPLEREVKIEDFDFGKFEIVQHLDEASAIVDFTPIKNPPNSQFGSIQFDFNRPVSLNVVKFIGINDLAIPVENIQVEIKIDKWSRAK